MNRFVKKYVLVPSKFCGRVDYPLISGIVSLVSGGGGRDVGWVAWSLFSYIRFDVANILEFQTREIFIKNSSKGRS